MGENGVCNCTTSNPIIYILKQVNKFLDVLLIFLKAIKLQNSCQAFEYF